MRVLLADDHPVVRAGIKAVLAAQNDIEVVAVEADGESALQRIRQLKPEVAVLDISMPGLSGIEVARQLNEDESQTALVMLSLHKTEMDVQAAIEAGVSGYVVKDAAAEELVEAIRSAARGTVWISPSVSGAMVNALRRGPQHTAQITSREREVLRLLADGLRSKEIAAKLDVSPKTIEGHRAALMSKLQIRSVAGLVKYAIRNHLTSV
ncbi:MAG: response regulator transcription factor [Deltaproteobacteria bacterium]|nr:response regulator transcription factor [Deltaproteobacteria bacterium]